MTNLDGSGRTVELAPGYRIVAPGLRGTATTHRGREPLTRSGGPEQATTAFDEALQASGVNDVMTIEMGVNSVVPPRTAKPVRTAAQEDGLILDVPDFGVDMGQLVLAIDEDGVVTWNFPVDQRGQLQTPATRGAGRSKRFLIRRHVPQASPASEGPKRGLLQVLGRKILKVLVYKVSDPVLGPVTEFFARKWEEKKRFYGVRDFSPDNYLQADVPALATDAWKKLGEGRALLFIHGTNSAAHSGFGNFPTATLEELYRGYNNRVFAFNHFTLSDDPQQNVEWFLKQIPSDIRLDIDIICHSRGGLVARTLSGALNQAAFPQVRVGKIVFAGAPNNGTILANPTHMTNFIDRYTTVLNLAPPGPLGVVADILEGIITVVKVVAHAALKGLPGLAAMDPQGDFIKRLNSPGARLDTRHYALAADFEPAGGLKDFIMQKIEDEVVDRVFGKDKNDLLVPTDGVYKGFKAPGFPIPDDRTVVFSPSRSVAHSYYFVQPETSDRLKQWLLATP